MPKRTNGMSLTILGLIIAAIGIVAPITWDWWNSKASLAITDVRIATVVETREDVKGLEITYNGTNVDNLSKITYRLENIGRIPLEESDVVQPPTVTLSQGNILNATVEELHPDNLKNSLEAKNGSVTISFKLLNPGDYIVVGMLVDSELPKLSASARIKGVSELKIVLPEQEITISKDIGWTVYVVSGVSFIFLVGFFNILSEIPKKKSQLNAIVRKETPVHSGEPVEVIKRYIENDLSFLTGDRKKAVKDAIPEDTERLDEKQSENLIQVIAKAINDEETWGPALTLLVLSGIGFWYVLGSIF